jgi:hypothetical protein
MTYSRSWEDCGLQKKHTWPRVAHLRHKVDVVVPGRAQMCWRLVLSLELLPELQKQTTSNFKIDAGTLAASLLPILHMCENKAPATEDI